MDVNQVLENFKSNNSFSSDTILAIQSDSKLRSDLVTHFQTNRDRQFALSLINMFIELRKYPDNEISINDLMLAGYLLGMHGHVEDCLKVWEAKSVDFDTLAGVDIQLIPFAGVDRTISFLKTQTEEEAKQALEYIQDCLAAGDFEELGDYYTETPWWV